MSKYSKLLICYSIGFLLLTACPGEKAPEENLSRDQNMNDIPYNTPAPTLTEAPVNKNEISSYKTILYDKNEHRINNIHIASEELNHAVIEPDEVFSFNKTLGRRTKDKGYEEAPIMVQGKKNTGTGGGICQLSSTLYNTALLADMEIVERHPHSKKVPYVPEGKDATVVYNSKDFQFKNTKNYPVEILVDVGEDEITISLCKINNEKQ